MSSSTPSYPPLAPGTVIQGLTVEASGTVWWQWITFFVFGNLFAGYWLVLAFLNAHPDVRYQIGQFLIRIGLKKAPKPHLGSAAAAARVQQQSLQLSAQQQVAGSVGVEPISPLNAAGSQPATLHHLVSARGGEVSSPLRSHRSRPTPPVEICVEQTITPRGSVPLSPRPSVGLTPKASVSAGNSNQPLHGTYTVQEVTEGASCGMPGGDLVEEAADGGESTYTDGSWEEPRRVKLEWRNLCYAVKSATGLRLIVQGVYGCANPGELQGLMGPSGAGKSTLMDLLSKRTDPTGSAAAEAALQQHTFTERLRTIASRRSTDATGTSSTDGVVTSPSAASAVSSAGLQSRIQPGAPLPHLESELLLNGAPLSRSAFMKLSAYVPQHDNLVPTMTSWESLSFYAGIILPPQTSAEKKRKRILEVLELMGLAHARDTLVGGMLSGGIQLRGLSGGERKRLAIACGVVAKPSLVFLDEPTSGLDSFAALNVVLFMKNMASQNGGALIASLHQPRSAIWGQLDQVTLLANGRLMYTGPTEDLTRWFTSLGYHYDPAEHGMASDWALDLVSLGFAKPQQGTREQQEGTDHRDPGTDDSDDNCSVQPAAILPTRASSSRFRGLASVASGSMGLPAGIIGSRRHQRQQATTSKCCMMSSKQELNEAAAAFVQRLRTLHPDWFMSAEDAAWRKANGAADGMSPTSSSQSGLSPIKVHRDSAQAVAGQSNAVAAAADVDESPFMQQTVLDPLAQDPLQAHGGPLQLTPTAVLEQGQDKEQGLWNTVYGGWRKFSALLWREALITTRNPADMGGRMMTFTYVALLSGLVAWNTPGGADSIMSRISSAYAVLSFYLLMPFVFMSLFTSDKRFFAADTTARLYHPFQYYMAKMSVTLPFNMIVAIVFHLVYYGMIGMRHGVGPMGMSCLISLLMGVTAMQAVYCCAIVASTQDLAFVYAIAWTALNLLVNPYMAMFNLYSLGWGFSWLRFFSPFNYAWQALIQIELSGRGFDCNTSSGLRVLGLIPDLLPKSASFNQVRTLITDLGRFSTPSQRGQCVASGDAIVEMYTDGLTFAQVVGILLAYFVLFMSVTYWVVLRSGKRHGPSL